MKKVTIKTEKALEVFNILKGASYQKLTDEDKVKVWKAYRALHPVATKFEDDSKDAAEKLKPEGLEATLEKAKDYEQKKQKGDSDLPMTEQEYLAFINGDWAKFNQLLAKAVKEFADAEVELEFETINEESFAKLMSSNDWKMEQVRIVGEFLLS